MDSDKEIALYYPYIDIDDEGLIKTSALYWDELQTIVPEYFDAPYNNRTSSEAFRESFLKPRRVIVFDDEVRKAGAEFLFDLEDIEGLHEGSPARAVWENLAKLTTERNRQYAPKIMLLHIEKLWFELKEHLQNILGYEIKDRKDGFIEVPDFIGLAYMARLASVIAEKDKSFPLTNLSSFQDILIDRYIDYEKPSQSELAKLSLQTVRIKQNVPFINVVRFRDKHRWELISFRRAIHKMSRQIGIGLDTSERQEKLQEIIKDEVLPAKEEIEARLKEGDIAFGLSALDITQATAVGMIASQGENLLAGIGAGLISLTISLVQSLREDRNIIKEHPLGYLYRAQKKFGAKN